MDSPAMIREVIERRCAARGWQKWVWLIVAAPILVAGCDGGYGFGSSSPELSAGDALPAPPPPPPPPPVAAPSDNAGSLAAEEQQDHEIYAQAQAARPQQPAAADMTHDLAVGAGGYVIGRQAEQLVRKTLARQGAMTTAAEDAAGIGVGAAATRATTGRALATLGTEGAAATEGAAVAEGATAAEAAAGAEAVGGAGIAEGGLAAGAAEVLLPAAVIVGGAYLLYKVFDTSTDDQKTRAAHGN